jgi:hypothetical protein
MEPQLIDLPPTSFKCHLYNLKPYGHAKIEQDKTLYKWPSAACKFFGHIIKPNDLKLKVKMKHFYHIYFKKKFLNLKLK